MVDSVNAVGEDASRVNASGVNASRMDMSSVDARRRRRQTRWRQTRCRVNAYSGCETGLVAASLEDSRRLHNDVPRDLSLILTVLREHGKLVVLVMVPPAYIGFVDFIWNVFSDELSGGIYVAVVLAVPLVCLAVWVFLRWKRRSRQATDLESGGGGWLGLFVSMLGWRD
jgi:hypothetical protein